MKAALISTLLLGLATLAAAQETKPLLPGDKAPDLKVAKYYQGEKIAKFEKGKVYVVEFWATWCGPCIDAIPHLNELSKKYKGKAEFVGVNVWDDEEGRDTRIQDFIKKMGDKMSYRVAVDNDELHMTKNWMAQSYSQGIPTAFIVNQEGQIAWIGHPMEIDAPLENVINKKHDLEATRKAQEAAVQDAMQQQKIMADIEEAQRLYTSGKKDEAIAILDKIAKESESMGGEAKSAKLKLFAKDDEPKAKSLLEEMSKGEFGDQANVAFFSIENATEEEGNRALAVYASDVLLKNMKNDDPILLYYAAPAYSTTKDHKKALSTLERALKAFDNSPYAKEAEMADFRKEIEEAIKKEKASIG
ncbi:hypothetical protein C0431_12035 [bacterium]|nr:hypothetical protein [bacterium]